MTKTRTVNLQKYEDDEKEDVLGYEGILGYEDWQNKDVYMYTVLRLFLI